MDMTSVAMPRMCVTASSARAAAKPAMLRSENVRFEAAKSAISRTMLKVRSRTEMAGRLERRSKSLRSTVTNSSSAGRRCVTGGFSNARSSFAADAETKRSYSGESSTQTASPTRNPAKPLAASRQSIRGNACTPHQEEDDGGQDDQDLPDRGMKEIEEPRLIRTEQVERDDADGVEQLHRDGAQKQAGGACAERGREGHDRRQQDQHRLHTVAAVVDVHAKARRAD